MAKVNMILMSLIFLFFNTRTMQYGSTPDIYAAIKRDDQTAIDACIAAGQAHLAEQVHMQKSHGGSPEAVREVFGEEYELCGDGVRDATLAVTPLYAALERKKITAARKLIMDGGALLTAGRWTAQRAGCISRPIVKLHSAAAMLVKQATENRYAYALLREVVTKDIPFLSGFPHADKEVCDHFLHPNNKTLLLEAIKRHRIGPELRPAIIHRYVAVIPCPVMTLEMIKQHYITPDQLFSNSNFVHIWLQPHLLQALLQGAKTEKISLECQRNTEEFYEIVGRDINLPLYQEMVNQHMISAQFLSMALRRGYDDEAKFFSADYSQAHAPDDALCNELFERLERKSIFRGRIYYGEIDLLLKRGRPGDFEKIFTIITMDGHSGFLKKLLSLYPPHVELVHKVMSHVKNRTIERMLLDYLIEAESADEPAASTKASSGEVLPPAPQFAPSAPPVDMETVTPMLPTVLTAPPAPIADKCPICQEPLNARSYVHRLPCGHNVHGDCISTWLNKQRTCPVCRTEVP